MNVDSLRFTKEHEWVAFDEDSDIVTIGITDFAAGELGDIVFVELPEVGRAVKSNETMGTIEAVKTVADLFSPVSGVVTAVNEELENNPAVVNQSPHDEGWLLKMQMSDRSELDALMTGEDYDAMVGKE
jgi:glycine cleavage system H protein